MTSCLETKTQGTLDLTVRDSAIIARLLNVPQQIASLSKQTYFPISFT